MNKADKKKLITSTARRVDENAMKLAEYSGRLAGAFIALVNKLEGLEVPTDNGLTKTVIGDGEYISVSKVSPCPDDEFDVELTDAYVEENTRRLSEVPAIYRASVIQNIMLDLECS